VNARFAERERRRREGADSAATPGVLSDRGASPLEA
jgi:hypothetical protein